MTKAELNRGARRSPATEDYVKAIYLLHEEHGQVTTSMVAAHLGVSPASATEMLQRLAALDLATYTPYRGVLLTDAGLRAALVVVRRHRLVESMLVEVLGLPWENVHAEADVLEHAISGEVESRIADRLGHPTADPHGDPIPAPDGTVPPTEDEPLVNLPPGAAGEVVRVTDQQPEVLRYLSALGLVPGAIVGVRGRAPFDGPLTIAVAGATHALDGRMARAIRVRSLSPKAEPDPRRP